MTTKFDCAVFLWDDTFCYMPRLPEYQVEIEEAGGDQYRWVIQSGADGVIAITDEFLGTHKVLAQEEEICDPTERRPIVFDGSYLRYDPKLGSLLIPDDITGTTQPEALIGLEVGSDEYIDAAMRMRRVSAQRIADAIRKPIKAKLLNGDIELFNPSS